MAGFNTQVSILFLSLVYIGAFSRSEGQCTCEPSNMGEPQPGCTASSNNVTYNSDPVVDRFRKYLRIRTDQPRPDYCCAVAYLKTIVDSIGGLEMKEVSFGATDYKPFLIVTWTGSDPSLPSILLNSHTDVVQADPSLWTHDPFCAFMEENGDIFARGTQDTKGIGMMYLEAIRNLKSHSFVPTRTIYVVFTPDEEIGGEEGFKAFVNSTEFTDLNVGVALDEGGATPEDFFSLYNAEKSAWWLTIKAFGPPTHGAFMITNGALENLFLSIPIIMAYRQTLLAKLAAGANAGDITSISPTYLNAGLTTDTGYVSNIQPGEATAGFDIRVSPLDDGPALLNRIKTDWAPAERNMTFEFVQFNDIFPPTVANASNPWYTLMVKAVEESGNKIAPPQTVSAFTDSRFLRARNISSFNFAPVSNTINLIHGNDEYLNAGVFLAGIPVYETIIQEFSSFTDSALRGASR